MLHARLRHIRKTSQGPLTLREYEFDARNAATALMALRVVLRRLSAATLVPARCAKVPRRVLPSARRALAAPPRTPDDEDDDADDEPPVEHELPQYWRDLESRTVNRKPRVDGPRGRGPRRKREEDYWQEAGLYDKPRNE